MVAEVEQRLRATKDVDAASTLAEAEGFKDCIVVTASRDQLVAAIAEQFKSGDNVWDAQPATDEVCPIGFWYDKTHRRISP